MAQKRNRNRTTSQSNTKTGIGCGVLALLLFVGGCNALLGAGDDDHTDDCAMSLTAGSAPQGWIGGGNGGGGRGFTNGGGLGDGSSGGSTGGGLDDVDVPEYKPGMDLADVTPDMQASAEAEHGDMRAVGTDYIWFDKRTNKPFPWEKKDYEKAKRKAEQGEIAKEELEEMEKAQSC
ncbi:hypothetical protein [Streptomyces sp. NPDC007110]|uniref:hypothetical protein n=1 Tax=Streptomyces sp. NPDC007110 TaxID=3156916 RepID=UPI0033D58B93